MATKDAYPPARAEVAPAGPGLDPMRLGSAGLSPREIEVLELASQGMINDGIGSELGISPRTVQKHLERVHAKLGVGTRMAAVAVARELSRLGGHGAPRHRPAALRVTNGWQRGAARRDPHTRVLTGTV